MDEEIHDTVARRLRRGRQRYTHGRRRLVEVLGNADHPLTIPEILERSDALSQSSVYRNLQLLEQAHTVHRIVTTDDSGARFELTEDLTAHHHHLICRLCGSVQDFYPSGGLEEALHGLVDEAVDTTDFESDHHRVDLVGTCADCGTD